MNFTQYNSLSSQVAIHNQFNRFLNDQAIAQVKAEKGRLAKKVHAKEVANIVEGRQQETFRLLTGRSLSSVVAVLGSPTYRTIRGVEALRIEHPQLSTALAIQQTLIMAGQEDDIATIIALSTIGAGRPVLTERTLLKVSESVQEDLNRSSDDGKGYVRLAV